MVKRVRLSLDMLPKHKEALEHLAEDDGESMSVVLRWLIRKEATARGFWPSPGLGNRGNGPRAS